MVVNPFVNPGLGGQNPAIFADKKCHVTLLIISHLSETTGEKNNPRAAPSFERGSL
jgi:hypothetical protein